MSDAVLVKDLFRLPDEVHKGDFVVKLLDTLQRPEDTARTFVVTKPLQSAFDRALGTGGQRARERAKPGGVYPRKLRQRQEPLHGGAEPAAAGNEAPGEYPSFIRSATSTRSSATKKLPELHFHMIGKRASRVRSWASTSTRSRAPSRGRAPRPLCRREALRGRPAPARPAGRRSLLRADSTRAAGAEGWGELAQGAGIASASRPARRRRTLERARGACSALLRRRGSRLRAGAAALHPRLDDGPGGDRAAREGAGLRRHRPVPRRADPVARAPRGGRAASLHSEVQKMVKLVEAQEAARPIPVVSFIARQRDLAEMVGEQPTPGAETIAAAGLAQALGGALRHASRWRTATSRPSSRSASCKPKSDDGTQQTRQRIRAARARAGSSVATRCSDSEDERAVPPALSLQPGAGGVAGGAVLVAAARAHGHSAADGDAGRAHDDLRSARSFAWATCSTCLRGGDEPPTAR